MSNALVQAHVCPPASVGPTNSGPWRPCIHALSLSHLLQRDTVTIPDPRMEEPGRRVATRSTAAHSHSIQQASINTCFTIGATTRNGIPSLFASTRRVDRIAPSNDALNLTNAPVQHSLRRLPTTGQWIALLGRLDLQSRDSGISIIRSNMACYDSLTVQGRVHW